MALYTLYPFKDDGTSETFVCFDLADDEEADVRALDLLDQHLSATQVVIWAGERKVATRRRIHPALRLVLGGSLPRRAGSAISPG
jgi:hypothetical protein